MKNKISDLRNHLFATLEDLRDKDNPMEIDRARAISDVAQTIINSARVEVDFMKMRGEGVKGTGFIPEEKQIEGPQEPGVRLVKGRAQRGSA
jgi:hypothetical protein